MKQLALLGIAMLLVPGGLTTVAGPLAQFRTVLGDIEVELYEDKPVTMGNFIHLVQSGAYQNMFLHRWIPEFVVQGGGFAVGGQGTNSFIFKVPHFGEITNEYAVGRRISNTFGTIAMAKTTNSPNTATSEWFFNLGDNSANLDHQNGGFTVFGKIVRGADVLNRFNGDTNSLRMDNWGSPLNNLPLYTTNQQLSLIFTDISLLTVKVADLDSHRREISWNSMAGLVNRVEYTTSMPPNWQLLADRTGNGERLAVVDEEGGAGKRFYRVRVLY